MGAHGDVIKVPWAHLRFLLPLFLSRSQRGHLVWYSSATWSNERKSQIVTHKRLCVVCVLTFTHKYSFSLASVPGGGEGV